MFCMVIVLSVHVLYGNSVERTFYMVIILSAHVLYGDSAGLHVLYGVNAEPTCFVW
jgi:hypothetical protein